MNISTASSHSYQRHLPSPSFGGVAQNQLMALANTTQTNKALAFGDIFSLRNVTISGLALGSGIAFHQLLWKRFVGVKPLQAGIEKAKAVATQATDKWSHSPKVQAAANLDSVKSMGQSVSLQTLKPPVNFLQEPVVTQGARPWSKLMMAGMAASGVAVLYGSRIAMAKAGYNFSIPFVDRLGEQFTAKVLPGMYETAEKAFNMLKCKIVQCGPLVPPGMPDIPPVPTMLPKANCDTVLGAYIDDLMQGSKCKDMQTSLESIGFPKIINNLSPSEDSSAIKKSLMIWSRTNHPDKGGSNDKYAMVSTAINDLLQFLREKPDLYKRFQKSDLHEFNFNR